MSSCGLKNKRVREMEGRREAESRDIERYTGGIG